MRKKHAYLAIVLLLLIFVGCQKKDKIQPEETEEEFKKPETTSIIGGQPIGIDNRNYQVSLSINRVGGTITLGGGSILSPTIVITAAHLFDGASTPFSGTVGAGSTSSVVSVNFNGQLVNIDTVIIHPLWDGNVAHLYDIAIVRLSQPFVLNNTAQPINCIALNQLSYQDVGETVTASGWGHTGSGSTDSRDQLRWVHMKVIGENSPLIPVPFMPRSDMLLYTHRNEPSIEGIGSGDSGGPLTASIPGIGDVLIGIASMSWLDGYDAPSAFTKVSEYLSWINSTRQTLDPSISGPSSFCTSETYSINNLPTGATVTWSANPSHFVSISTSGNSATLTNIFGGELVLTANISLGAWSTSVSKTIFSEAALNSSMSCTYAFINGLNFCNSYPVNNDASIVIDNEIYGGYYESAVISANSNISNFSISLVSKTPSSGQVYITSVGTNQYIIGLKGATTSATVQAIYQNPCGGQVSQNIYVRAPYGAPMLPEIE